jgi:(1->4)-alpha-D-glucan 1-alpha-D-glucosylmutase
VQLHGEFTFDDAAGVADYVSRLGVSHLYLSPVLQAAPGSTHGYDVVDPTRVSAALGGAEGHERLQAALGTAGLGQLLDIVPNHMAVSGRENAWWWDVLENGPASQYATYFDVDWDPPEHKLRNIVLLPVLGDHYGRELEAGHLQVEREGGGFVLRYHEHAAPISPRTIEPLLAVAATRLPDGTEAAPDPAEPGRRVDIAGPAAGPAGASGLTGAAGSTGVGAGTAAFEAAAASGADEASPAAMREALESIATAFGRLPTSIDVDPASVKERQRDKEILRVRLAELCASYPEVAAAVDAEVAALNADVDRLDTFLDRQNFRMAWWKTAGEELDYRRFFDINDLAGLRVEDPEVFLASHGLILTWLHGGVIDGVRIDHVDGLLDPEAYLDRLIEAAPEAWVVVEKILEGDETVPSTWPVAGTTGYDWLNLVGAIFDDAEGCEELVTLYREWTGVTDRYEEMVQRGKHAVLDGPLAADLRRLAGDFAVICESHRRYRDYTGRDLTDTLAEVLASFGVYRTYLRAGEKARELDVEAIDAAVLAASIRRPDLDNELLGFVRDVLLLRVPGAHEQQLALRFQQVSGPVMAKAVEDTTFYRYLPLTWRNEVGGDPARRPLSSATFYAALESAQRDHPEALLATSTHDTKRAEDVRARLSVLAEMPGAWAGAVERWRVANVARGTVASPDRNTEWLLYQAVVGAWPISVERITAYMEKATREAKVHTSWTQPDEYYDVQLRLFVEEMLADAALVGDLEAFVAGVRRPGWVVGLGQKLCTLTAPGVPDLYQGSECWDLSLVDPDNRRPVDYARRRLLLESASERSAADAWASEDGDGATKLAVVHAALRLRAAHPSWYAPGVAGSVSPLVAEGPAESHLIAFIRGGRAATLATRWPVRLEAAGGWGATSISLPDGLWTDRLSGATWSGTVRLADVLSRLPVALLVLDDPDPAGWGGGGAKSGADAVVGGAEAGAGAVESAVGGADVGHGRDGGRG